MAQILKYVIGKDYRPLTVLEAKGGNTFTPDYDKSNWVQARQYEDSLRQVFVEITNEDGSAYDLTGANVLFEGILPDNEHKILDNSHAVFYEDPTTGKFRFDMPAQSFSVAGQYKQAFFRVMKDYRNIATLEFKFEVLADMVVTGLVPRDYISPLDDLFNTIKETETKNVAELKKIVDDKVAEITNLMTTLNQTNTATLSELNSAKTALGALEDKIKQDGLFTQGEAEEFKKSVFIKMVTADSLEELLYGYKITIVHNQRDYPKPTVFYYENAIGTEIGGLGAGSFGETLTKLVPCEAEYTDNNSIVVRIPRNFYMDAKPYYKYGDWYLISGNKTIKISLGNVDDGAAKAGDGKGSSYLSHSTGYFNYPTAPSDLRAVYVNDTAERLERK
ncbi:BppU family phage baseplate upper protein [Ligilactobacillus salivarius]|uniref:BppU family phage baseplate upper protein n=1 Tax=Ligilactobacillus salivarius TaxID=1624 RepID=UPI001368E4BF|nr:BppU family phage baseplate upper protein [Ligilactobacillus salivarius]MYZ80028.1 phage baseplate upper protein [Ligilactobacillus salivarius]